MDLMVEANSSEVNVLPALLRFQRHLSPAKGFVVEVPKDAALSPITITGVPMCPPKSKPGECDAGLYETARSLTLHIDPKESLLVPKVST